MKSLTLLMVLCSIVLAASPDTYATGNESAIGVFTTVKGAVAVQHSGAARPHRAKYQDNVILKDVIETDLSAYAKALLEDDTLLSVAENSRVEITEHLYNPVANFRSTIVHLAEGTVRALVGGVFKAPGSRFEVHTSTAIAAARGTYFIVWLEGDRTTGMANIGEKGDVAFTAGGEMVVVKPGYYSIAIDGGAPIPPAAISLQIPQLHRVVEATGMKDSANAESTKTVLSYHAPDVTSPTTQPVLWANGTVSGGDGASRTKLLSGSLPSSQPVASVNSTTTGIGQAVGATVGQAGSTLGSTVTAVGSTVGQLGGALSPTVTAVGSTVGQLGAALSPTVTAVGSTVGQLGTALTSTVAIGTTAPAITAPVVTTIGTAITPVTTTVTSAVSATLVPATSILKLK
jgi:hypothetical protein